MKLITAMSAAVAAASLLALTACGSGPGSESVKDLVTTGDAVVAAFKPITVEGTTIVNVGPDTRFSRGQRVTGAAEDVTFFCDDPADSMWLLVVDGKLADQLPTCQPTANPDTEMIANFLTPS